MNCKRKGARAERKVRAILEEKGYSLIVKAGGSFGLFDLIVIGVNYEHCLLIQCKSNRLPARSELDKLKAFLVPNFCKKQLWCLRNV
ncbi:MAG TPA: hypothetical protein VHT73_17070 [Thermodesulfobacteriota bacterium]|nr:hypothetical protein [Thermodesulfobacteriota bacterium]